MEAQQILDEIDRKALETLQRILNDRERGVISDAQARASVHTLFEAVSGLCSRDSFDLISDASTELNAPKGPNRMTRLLVSPVGAIVQLEYEYGEAFLTVKTRVPSDTKAGWSKIAKASFEEELIPFDAAKERMEQYEASLLRQGYQELS